MLWFERFVAADGEIFEIIFNGKLLTVRTADFAWQAFLSGLTIS
jgi:hypothetical protein